MTQGAPEPLDATPQLKAVLSRMASNYVPGGVEIEFFDGPATVAAAEGDGRPTVYVDPALPAESFGVDGPDALRLLVNWISHECEHVRESGLDEKRTFMAEYPEPIRPLAGYVVNLVEDQFIDANRTARYPGIARIERWETATMMQDDEFRPPMGAFDEPLFQLGEGMMQLAIASGVKGIDDADEQVRGMLNRIHPILQAAKTESDRRARRDMAHEIMDIIKPVVKEAVERAMEMMDEFREFLEEMMEDLQEQMGAEDYDAAEEAAEADGMSQAGYAGAGDEEDGGDADGDDADGSTDAGGDDGTGGTRDEDWVVRPLGDILGGRTPRDTVIRE